MGIITKKSLPCKKALLICTLVHKKMAFMITGIDDTIILFVLIIKTRSDPYFCDCQRARFLREIRYHYKIASVAIPSLPEDRLIDRCKIEVNRIANSLEKICFNVAKYAFKLFTEPSNFLDRIFAAQETAYALPRRL